MNFIMYSTSITENIKFSIRPISANPSKPANGSELRKSTKSVVISEYPYLFSIMLNNGEVCSGVLIGDKHVLTTAQCASLVKANTLVVRVGSNYDTKEGKLYTTGSVVLHDAYNPETLVNNIAVIAVVEDLSNITEIVMNSDTSYVKPGIQGTAAGWGRLNSSTVPEELIDDMEVQIMDKKSCLDRPLSAGEFCGGDVKESKGTCYIPGSPLITKTGNQKKLIGMVSMRDADVCQQRSDVFVDVSSYKNWILRVIGK
ncbi:hypothetical protein QAD02_015938 [Eretmocerus hayati]|uniref:Uncharacterized protein n=1 Tax=Eretmocerus hayati TaxID=131215 RepID=A0ACC2P9M8_9HYME|nr:hypothetical protein QAD02_015938 [Eretmocerus hayati]